ncbi:MAG TPA: hypothetical protein VIL86_01035 [Tepidisphaeraceae bacterium]|jgi:hypothetical protein
MRKAHRHEGTQARRDAEVFTSCLPASCLRASLAAWLLLLAAAGAQGRTIFLDFHDFDQIGGIAEAAPRQSLAFGEGPTAAFSNGQVALTPQVRFLVRYALDKVPAGNQIVYAELIVPATNIGGTEPRFYLWRMLADWGPGVCYAYRSARPEKVNWAKPGAGGIGSDRAAAPTDIPRIVQAGQVTINVTEDVEMWYSGAAKNNGWIFTVEDPGTIVILASPLWNPIPGSWRLRITYEPKSEK